MALDKAFDAVLKRRNEIEEELRNALIDCANVLDRAVPLLHKSGNTLHANMAERHASRARQLAEADQGAAHKAGQDHD